MGRPSIGEVVPSPSPTPTLAPAVVPSSLPSVAGVAPNPVPASTSPATVPSQQGAGQYLAEAIRWLRKDRAPASALRLLDRRESELVKAGFGHETLILRVEALLALGRRAEVLRLLDAASLTHVAASRALLVTRGELRAEANRCAEGLGDFELVLARSRQVDRQALTGRALCRKRLGDLAGAGADIQRLREEFPNQRLPGELER
jgi:tetratricopeptide (TPR) repeat protein